MANSLRAKLKKLNYEGKITDEELNELLDKLDGHDKELVKHGHWNIEKIGVKNYKGTCSVCGLYYEDEPKQILTFSDMEYCPRCGAKMDEEVE